MVRKLACLCGHKYTFYNLFSVLRSSLALQNSKSEKFRIKTQRKAFKEKILVCLRQCNATRRTAKFLNQRLLCCTNAYHSQNISYVLSTSLLVKCLDEKALVMVQHHHQAIPSIWNDWKYPIKRRRGKIRS